MSVRRTVLPGGVRILTQQTDGHRSIALGAWIAVGSRDEDAGFEGTTHFLEHLLFKGTPSRSAQDIAASFDAIGGDLNAYTTKEFTCVHARTLADDLPLAVETIGDMLRNALIAPEDLEAERGVVLEEIAMHEDAPEEHVFDLFHDTIWSEHPLRHAVQGRHETIARIARDDVAAYYRQRYELPATVLAAAGPVEHDALVELAARAFEGAEPAPPLAPRTGGHAPGVTGVLGARVRDIEQAHLVYGTAGLARADERRWAVGILNTVLGGGMSSRLFQEIRERRGLAYSISSHHQGFAETGVFSVYAGCSSERAREVLAIAREQIASIVADGITDEERARAVGHLRGGLVMSFDDPGAIASHLGKSELTLGEILSTGEMIARIEAVTLEEVRAAAHDVLATQPWSLAVVAPVIGADLDGFVGAAA